MKKEKPFEIIEEGRFLNNKDMSETTGGNSCIFAKYTTCTNVGVYDVVYCSKVHSVHCGPTSAVAYRSCSEIGGKTTCSSTSPFHVEYPCTKYQGLI